MRYVLCLIYSGSTIKIFSGRGYNPGGKWNKSLLAIDTIPSGNRFTFIFSRQKNKNCFLKATKLILLANDTNHFRQTPLGANEMWIDIIAHCTRYVSNHMLSSILKTTNERFYSRLDKWSARHKAHSSTWQITLDHVYWQQWITLPDKIFRSLRVWPRPCLWGGCCFPSRPCGCSGSPSQKSSLPFLSFHPSTTSDLLFAYPHQTSIWKSNLFSWFTDPSLPSSLPFLQLLTDQSPDPFY